MSKRVYVVCSVRGANEEEVKKVEDYVAKLEKDGCEVHYPPRDVEQDCDTGASIVDAHLEAMRSCDEVHVMWNVESKGSHFDLGMAVALGKKVVPVENMTEDSDGKSYWKVMKEHEKRRGDEEHPLSAIDMINRVGMKKIKVQSIHQSLAELNRLKDGTTKITFYSEPVDDLIDISEARRIGLVIWFNREDLDA